MESLLNSTINTYMAHQHKECDTQFASAEEAVAKGDWQQGGLLWSQFAQELEKHFMREEFILFPDFEDRTGMAGGPTQMMRMEHEQMRALVVEINKALQSQEQDQFLALTETLMVTMQQHNMKEEQMLYPMIDQSLPDASDTIERMDQL